MWTFWASGWGDLGSEGSLSVPFAPPTQAKHSRGSKLGGGGSQLGHREHIGERLGGTLRLSDSMAPFASGAAPEELYLATLCQGCPFPLSLTPQSMGPIFVN